MIKKNLSKNTHWVGRNFLDNFEDNFFLHEIYMPNTSKFCDWHPFYSKLGNNVSRETSSLEKIIVYFRIKNDHHLLLAFGLFVGHCQEFCVNKTFIYVLGDDENTDNFEFIGKRCRNCFRMPWPNFYSCPRSGDLV